MRAFVAVGLSSDVSKSIREFQAESGINASPVRPENLHITLQFLGQIKDRTALLAIDVLEEIEFSKFAVGFAGVGAFPNPNSPRVVWVGTDNAGGEALKALAKKVNDALVPLGLEGGKPFVPHLTIFRVKRSTPDISSVLAESTGRTFGSQQVESIRLVQSTLTPSGSVYADLCEVSASQ